MTALHNVIVGHFDVNHHFVFVQKILCALKDYFLFILQGRISYPKNPPALVSRFLNELPVNGGYTP